MSWKTKLAAVTTGLILAAPAAAQTPSPGAPGGGTTMPGMPGPTTPSTPSPTTPTMPGSPTPRMPGSSTPGVPGSSTPGIQDPTPGVQCPSGQGRRPGSSMCMPTQPGAPIPPTTR